MYAINESFDPTSYCLTNKVIPTSVSKIYFVCELNIEPVSTVNHKYNEMYIILTYPSTCLLFVCIKIYFGNKIH